MGSKTFSARWDSAVIDRLEQRSRSEGTNKSRLAQRYIDEGTRMDEHPGIVFRDGPTGRRAGLAGGPDVWEVIATVRMSEGKGEAAVAAAAEALDISHGRVRVAVRYYAAFPNSIDERIRRNLEQADEDEAAWAREQASLL